MQSHKFWSCFQRAQQRAPERQSYHRPRGCNIRATRNDRWLIDLTRCATAQVPQDPNGLASPHAGAVSFAPDSKNPCIGTAVPMQGCVQVREVSTRLQSTELSGKLSGQNSSPCVATVVVRQRKPARCRSSSGLSRGTGRGVRSGKTAPAY